MIPSGILKHGDYLLWKTNRKTRWFKNIGGHTQELNERICKINNTDVLNGYNHIGMIDKDPSYIIHAHPPRATRDRIDEKWWKKQTKRMDIEVWRLKEKISEERQNHITDEFYRLVCFKWNKRKKQFIGAKYDWYALIFCLFSIFRIGLGSRSHYHCHEIVFDSARVEDIILSSQGINDPLPSPNNCINSNLLFKVWGEYLK